MQHLVREYAVETVDANVFEGRRPERIRRCRARLRAPGLLGGRCGRARENARTPEGHAAHRSSTLMMSVRCAPTQSSPSPRSPVVTVATHPPPGVTGLLRSAPRRRRTARFGDLILSSEFRNSVVDPPSGRSARRTLASWRGRAAVATSTDALVGRRRRARRPRALPEDLPDLVAEARGPPPASTRSGARWRTHFSAFRAAGPVFDPPPRRARPVDVE